MLRNRAVLPTSRKGYLCVYRHMAKALKPGAPLAFTYHHNKLDAYCAIGVAILDAGLTCSASFPCPAEMGGSIHIHGTASSIIDTVFVCRETGQTRRKWLFPSGDELAPIVANDLAQLTKAGRKPTAGDTRCIIFGHLTRMAIWNLRKEWDASMPTEEQLERFSHTLCLLADPEEVLGKLEAAPDDITTGRLFSPATTMQETRDAVAF